MHSSKISFLLTALLVFSGGSKAHAEPPKVAISPVTQEVKLGYREKELLQQVDIVQIIREILTDSKSFTVVTRDNKTVQALLKEKSLGEKSIARRQPGEELGLDIASFILVPTVKKLDISTTYTPMEMLPDYFERKDRATFALSVTVIDAGGNTKFEQFEDFDVSWGPVEANIEDKKKNKALYTAQTLKKIKLTTRVAIDALIERINPIIVIDVQGDNIVIDRGDNNNFNKDSIFVIRSEPKVVIHPVTKEEFVISAEEVARAKVVSIYQKYSTLKLTSGSIEQVEPGAEVQIINEK